MFHRWYDIISTLFQRDLCIDTNLASDKYELADRLINFILQNKKKKLYNILTIQLLINL